MTAARSLSKRVFDTYNHLGICLSYSQTWNYVRKFAKETFRVMQLKEGNWIVAYDNMNIHKNSSMKECLDTKKPGTSPADWL